MFKKILIANPNKTQEAGFPTVEFSSDLDTALAEAPELCLLQDMAAMAALLYMRRRQSFEPSQPARLETGWHKHSRRLPE